MFDFYEKTIDYREENMCCLCKYWLGRELNITPATGSAVVKNTEGLCKEDGATHKERDLCVNFEKRLTYC